jgi:putative transcriptional regulator
MATKVQRQQLQRLKCWKTKSDKEDMPKNVTDFSSIFVKQPKPEKGKLLLAEPFMESPEFKRSVILLTEHNEKGTMGFIINRKLNVSPSQAIDEFPEFDDELYYGGPVNADQLFYLHTRPDLLEGGQEIMPGMFLGGDFSTLKNLIDIKQITPKDIRFFVGYSGWAAGQLKKEIKDNSWIVLPGTTDHIKAKFNKNLWKDILKGLGGKYSIVAEFPEDPTLN